MHFCSMREKPPQKINISPIQSFNFHCQKKGYVVYLAKGNYITVLCRNNKKKNIHICMLLLGGASFDSPENQSLILKISS